MPNCDSGALRKQKETITIRHGANYTKAETIILLAIKNTELFECKHTHKKSILLSFLNCENFLIWSFLWLTVKLSGNQLKRNEEFASIQLVVLMVPSFYQDLENKAEEAV